MTEAHNQFGRIATIEASAVGSPGSRRFRLYIVSRTGATATIWMEKEQLFNLAVGLKHLIQSAEEREAQRGGASPSDEPLDPPNVASQSLEFQVRQFMVGYDERTLLYLIVATDVETPEGALADLSLMATKQEVDTLADKALEVCAAGRPLCPLCSAPMNVGEKHICPKHNGHSQLGETRDFY